MFEANLFHGIAVVIDDEINDAKSDIRAIIDDIKKAGCPVVAVEALPEEADLRGYGGASFFVVDWNMYGPSLRDGSGIPQARPPEQLRKENAAKLIGFLRALIEVRFAPVFLFTQESVEDVQAELSKHPDLYDSKETSHIRLVSKVEVRQKGVFAVFEEYLTKVPSAYVLKRWEREYDHAKNELFRDFYGKSILWPLILWEAFREDRVNPSAALGELIGRNLISRMTPFDFDMTPFEGGFRDALSEPGSHRDMLLKVLEGERYLPGDQLHSKPVAAGDVFKLKGRYYINIRPDCDCIPRQGETLDSVELYLLRGCKVPLKRLDYDKDYGVIRDRDPEATVFPIHGGLAVSFQLKDLHIKEWRECNGHRVGRVLPPFITRLQQRYSAYLQRPGLTRIPKGAIPDREGAQALPTPSLGTPGPARADGPELTNLVTPPKLEPTEESRAARGTATTPLTPAAGEPQAVEEVRAPQPARVPGAASQETSPKETRAAESGGPGVSDSDESKQQGDR